MNKIQEVIDATGKEFDEMFPLPLSPEGGINLLIRQILEEDRANFKAFTRQAQLRVLEVVRERIELMHLDKVEPTDPWREGYGNALNSILAALDLKEEQDYEERVEPDTNDPTRFPADGYDAHGV